MICQECELRPAMVHLEERTEEGHAHIWLCEICALARKDARFLAVESERDGETNEPWGGSGSEADDEAGHASGDDRAFEAAYLGQRFGPEVGPDESAVCPACGFELVELGQTNRLGCATCYDAFRDRLRPLLVRIHHHSAHLGRSPQRSAAGATRENEIARHRAALEKAIVAERYEEAARLRDLIARLESEIAGSDPSQEAR